MWIKKKQNKIFSHLRLKFPEGTKLVLRLSTHPFSYTITNQLYHQHNIFRLLLKVPKDTKKGLKANSMISDSGPTS